MLPLRREFLGDESGATGTEYILIAVFLSVVAFAAVNDLERNLIGSGVSRAQESVVRLGGRISG